MQREVTYFAAGADADSELARLRELEAASDPATTHRLEQLGVTHGWRCLEVGAGGGSIARWLADRVGPTGCVVAADMDPRFLGPLEWLPNVEVRRLDITRDDVEEGVYDLVHSRAVLMHLDDPAAAIEKMVSALRPGGVLLVEDPDSAARAPIDPSHPRSAVVERVHEAMRAAATERGIFDTTLGRRLPGLLERAGLHDVDNECLARVMRGSSPRTRLPRKTISRFRQIGLAAGVSSADWQTFIDAYDDPTFEMMNLLIVQAWGRK